MKNKIAGIVIGVGLLLSMRVMALPIIAIDLDPGTAGIQSSLTVSQGQNFQVDVILSPDIPLVFDAVLFDLAFNNAGAVLALTAGPTAGGLADAGNLGASSDALTFAAVNSGSALATGVSGALPGGYAASIGETGYLSLGAAFGAGAIIADQVVLSLDFTALGLGASSITAFPGLGDMLASFGVGVAANVAAAQVNVINAVPVPLMNNFTLLLTILLLSLAAVNQFKNNNRLGSVVNKGLRKGQ